MTRSFAALALCLLTVSARAATPRYSVIDLGTLLPSRPASVPGGTVESMALGINAKGEVTGFAGRQAFVWRQGVMTGLGILNSEGEDYATSNGSAINTLGQVVGGTGTYDTQVNGESSSRAFFWHDGKMELIGDNPSEARDLNDKQEIVGVSFHQGFYYSRGKFVELPKIGYFSKRKVSAKTKAFNIFSDVRAVNAKSDIVGSSTYTYVRLRTDKKQEYFSRPILWRRRGKTWRIKDLGTLRGFSSGDAIAINTLGTIVGEMGGYASNEKSKAAVWKQSKITVLPNLPGRTDSIANSINDRGQIVGACGGRAVLWQKNKVFDLNALLPPNSGWILTTANGINVNGWIVGDGLHDGKKRGFLLRPR